MVVRYCQTKRKRRVREREQLQGCDVAPRIRKITGATPYGYVEEYLTPFGGVLPLEKLFDALEVEQAFAEHFVAPERTPKLGHWRMVKTVIDLQFMGYHRLYHLTHLQEDAMLKGILGVAKLPAVSTFWRCMNSYGLPQDRALLKLIAVVRERAWLSLDERQRYSHLHIDIDTTVKTIYGNKEGGRKGHNRKHRGKKALRPVLAFISETKEYLAGKLRAGRNLSGKEIRKFIAQFKTLLPPGVKQLTIRADSEFYCWQAIQAARAAGFDYIIAVRGTRPTFDKKAWYSVGKNDAIQYNEAFSKGALWKSLCRYVAMRIPKDPKNPKHQQGEIFEDDEYTYRIFVTSREEKPHEVIAEYDGRAGAEKLISEAHRDELAAIPSKRFAHNRAFFQIAMFSYNLWRHLKAFANQKDETTWSAATNATSRLRLLLLAAKVTFHSERTEIKYSKYLVVKPTLDHLFKRLDHLRHHREVWKNPSPTRWQTKLLPREQDRIVQKILCTADG